MNPLIAVVGIVASLEKLYAACLFSRLFLFGLVLVLLLGFSIFGWYLYKKETQLPPPYSEFLFSEESIEEEEENWESN
ncbi:hypothetical protein A946_02930 [Methylacidiphilum kamchatkense Kam1]|uniref:Cbb3-type cytochrome oxidase component FixQ n=1 Tax=Methylacidiphilum kamchatkense Kam1 TaxID=1202785 RepID=A0A0C1RLS5_9BACT|nr:hypothetical protein [Methylacidiphilum kamchatkense]KIE59012.1 hypothetical protein A946_02930 [Methylacidiphilum kamchatkense Kam1]QDQ43095.1 hypothetical protein kam1_1883 [Methylacidiphilum kamchatkense Kam1]